jgi:tetratricopeptide (TPR) repeat protein
MDPGSEPLRLVLGQQHDWLHGAVASSPTPENRAVNPRTGDRLWTAWDDFRQKRYSKAAATLEGIVATDADFTAWFYLGVVRLRMGQPDRAAESFLAASAVEPGTAADPLLYRGIALMQAARYPAALEALNRFIERVPTESHALLNRAIVHYHLRERAAALTDLAEAERLGESGARVHGLRLQIWRAAGENARAEAEHKLLLNTTPMEPDAWAVRAEARLATDPAGALADFDAALALDPDYLPALRGKASCLSEGLNRPADAVKVLDQVVRLAGATIEDRSGSAVLLARLGRKAQARDRARKCLGPDTPPLPLYQAASALALTAETPADRAEVVAILRRVLKGDVAWAKGMPQDPDLKAVHDDPTFKALTAASGVLDGPDKR